MKKLTTILLGLLVLGCTETPEQEQPLKNINFDLSEYALEFEADGGEGQVTVFTGRKWVASVVDNDVDWIELSHIVVDDFGSEDLLIEVEPNDTDRERFTTILVTVEGSTEFIDITQEPGYLELPTVVLGRSGDAKSFSITSSTSEWDVEVIEGADWCSAEKDDSGMLAITADAHDGENDRIAKLQITAGEMAKELSVTQIAFGDKDVILLSEATIEGGAVNLIVMGDGYTLVDFTEASGKYEREMRLAADNFFSVYPYSAYKEYFNIWMVGAVSNQSGMSCKRPAKSVDNVFATTWEGQGSTGISCNDDIVNDYTRLVADKVGVRMIDLNVIMPINENQYAGTCQMNMGYNNRAGSIAMCPVSLHPNPSYSFKGLVVHEAGGHGFAKLLDEYVYYNREMPFETQNDIYNWKQIDGWMFNVDVSDEGDLTLSEASWSGFEGKPGYDMVNVFEGGYMYARGIWRPEYNSCMNNNIAYFNAPSRWAQVRWIMKLSGTDSDYTVDEFIADEEGRIPEYPEDVSDPYRTRAGEKPFLPLGRPIIR